MPVEKPRVEDFLVTMVRISRRSMKGSAGNLETSTKIVLPVLLSITIKATLSLARTTSLLYK